MKVRLPALGSVTRAEWLFSAKSFGAAMLAMYLALRCGLPRPFWAMMTTYVVASPLAGAVRSKAVFRFAGTLLGSTAAVLMVGSLGGQRELLMLALSMWMAACLYVSLQDRTPRSYVFMLAGYTAALIGFPSVDTPLQIFDIAVARVEEIGIGILCGSIVHSVFFPVSTGPALLQLLDRSLQDSAQWLHDVLRGTSAPGAESPRTDADRRRVAADISQLRMLSTHVPYDAGNVRWTAGALHAMQDAVAALTAVASAVEDRLKALREFEGGLPTDVVALLPRVDRWVGAQSRAWNRQQAHEASEQLDTLVTAIRAVADDHPPPGAPWPAALRISLSLRLEELVACWRRCAELRIAIDRGLAGAAPRTEVSALGNHVLHRDRGMAALSACATVLATLLGCGFWIITAWPSGSAVPMMAAVFCMLFSTLDDPTPAIRSFLKGTLWSVPLAALYVLVALPLMHDFGMLVLLCAPAFLVLGAFAARNSPGNLAMPIIFGVAGALAMHDTATADLVSFSNSMLAQVLGTIAAIQVIALVRTVSAEWSARRIQRATWRELAELASVPGERPAGEAYAVRMLDRIGLLAPRIAQATAREAEGTSADALHDLRIGADIVALQSARASVPPAAADAVLGQVATLFRARGAPHASLPPASMLQQLDGAIARTLGPHVATAQRRRAIAALVGLRRNLFPRAPHALDPAGDPS